MNSKFIAKHDYAIEPQNLGPWLMKSSQSNSIRSPGSYLARSYLIATVNVAKLKFVTDFYWHSNSNLLVVRRLAFC